VSDRHNGVPRANRTWPLSVAGRDAAAAGQRVARAGRAAATAARLALGRTAPCADGATADEDKIQHAEFVPGSAAPLSIDEEAMIEAGRRIFLESVEVSRDFARQMITVSSGAIPVYVALLGAAGLKHRSTATLTLASTPALLFLSAMLFFVIALLPRKEFFAVQIIDEIRDARNRLVRARFLWIMLGFVLFGSGICAALTSILLLMTSTN